MTRDGGQSDTRPDSRVARPTPSSGTPGCPRVSVIIPAFNASRTINEALESVFAQTYRDLEVIAVDDGSTDDTLRLLNRWDDRVLTISQVNGGPGCARNAGLRAARGELVAFLDADDVWMPRKLQRQVRYFDRFPATGMLHTAAVVSRSPHRTMNELADDGLMEADVPAPIDAFAGIFHGDVNVNTLTVMARRDAIDAVGGFDERRELHVEDWDLWLRLAAEWPVGFLPLPLAIHRPGGTMSSARERTFRGQELVIDKVAPLCARACDRHRGDPVTCTTERRHRLYAELGYVRFWSGRLAEARTAFGEALRCRPGDLRSRAYYLASFGRRGWLQSLRGLRRAIAPAAEPPADQPTTPVNLVDDTPYRRARISIASLAHRADSAIHRTLHPDRRVLFEAASPLSLAIFAPVYRQLATDGRIEFWFTTSDASWGARAIFGEDFPDRVIPPAQAAWMKVDAYVNADFWNMTWLRRRTQRVHLFHGVAGKYGLDAPVRIAPVVATFDRLMFPNRDRLMRYAEAGLVDPEAPAAALIGYPKVDCLVDGSLDRARIGRELDLDPRQPTVLYAPTWSPHSSLNVAGEAIIRSLARLPVNLVVKLHDRSRDGTTRGSGGIDWGTRLARLERDCGIRVADGPDASPYLYAADLLVSDHSSVAFEYTLLDRPIVLFDAPDLASRARVNPQKVAMLREAACVARTAAELTARVAESLAAPGRLSVRRRAIADSLFYCPGGAARRAARCLYDVLSLAEPEAATNPAFAVGPAVDQIMLSPRS